mgnify:CR=1 FL=1
MPETTPTWNAGYARRECNWQSTARWGAGAAAWNSGWGAGQEIVALYAEKSVTCASMPGGVVSTVGADPTSSWLLYLVLASLVWNLIFCLGFIYYLMKKNKALMVSVVEAPAAAAADESAAAAEGPAQLPLVGVTPLVPDGASASPAAAAWQLTDGSEARLAVLLADSLRSGLYATAEQFDAATAYVQAPDSVQQQLAVLMRAETTGLYLFTPAGDRYHLRGACHVSQNERVLEMAPCEFCVITPMTIYEGSILQTWYANTLMYDEQRY